MSEKEFSQLEQPEREELEKKSTEIQLKTMEIVRLIQQEEKNQDRYKELNTKQVCMQWLPHCCTKRQV